MNGACDLRAKLGLAAAQFGLDYATSGPRGRSPEAELSGRQAKLGAQIASSVHEALLLFPPVFGPDHAGDCLMKP